jgi:hypothetical protein
VVVIDEKTCKNTTGDDNGNAEQDSKKHVPPVDFIIEKLVTLFEN